MPAAQRPSRYRRTSREGRRILAAGESGRFEFKSTPSSVTPNLFATLANWVALDPGRDVAHLLVGVEEVTEERTGLVRGVPCGLPKGLERTVARILDVARETHPIPVDVFVIEEGTDEVRPFVRVEVRPTMPPHYDAEGRRQTRQGRSTRALTDEEMLRIYLDREAGSFAARFRTTARELQVAVGTVGIQVDQMAADIEVHIAQPVRDLAFTAGQAADAAESAAHAAMSAQDDVRQVESLVSELSDMVDELRGNMPESVAARVVAQRQLVWWRFTVDTWDRISAEASRLSRKLHTLLSADISLADARNIWELRVWQDLLREREEQRNGRGTLRWWAAAITQVNEFVEDPAYTAPELPDLRAELRADLDRALDDESSATRRFSKLLP